MTIVLIILVLSLNVEGNNLDKKDIDIKNNFNSIAFLKWRGETTNLLVENVEKKYVSCFHIMIPTPRTKICEELLVMSGDIEGLKHVQLIRKYIIKFEQQICDINQQNARKTH